LLITFPGDHYFFVWLEKISRRSGICMDKPVAVEGHCPASVPGAGGAGEGVVIAAG